MVNVLHAEIEANGCDVELSLNDIPVWSVRHRLGAFHAMPVHEYLVRGANGLRLRRLDATPVPPPPQPGEPSAPPPEVATARVRIAAYREGESLGQGGGQQFAVLDYRSHDASGNPQAVAETVFTLPQWPFAWAWESLAAPGWGSPQATAQVFRWLQEFAGRFQRADVGWLGGVLQPKMAEYCRAYGYDPALEMREFQGRMQLRAADPSFRVTAFTETDLALRPCAGGRLVDCVLATGEPAIRWSDQRAGARGAMKLKLGYAGQQLLVFR